jgi:hypothetical protein
MQKNEQEKKELTKVKVGHETWPRWDDPNFRIYVEEDEKNRGLDDYPNLCPPS